MKTIIIFSIAFLFSIIIQAQEPTQWRGPNGNGIYNDVGLLDTWPASGPEILWHFDGLGDGFSSPAFANGKIYTAGMEEPTGYVYCLNMDGTLNWKASYGEEFYNSYPGSRSTPVIAGNKLYMFSGNGVVTCMDAGNGRKLWQKNTFSDLDGGNIRWGITETLVIDGEYIYVTPGGAKNNIVALNRENGETIWSSVGLGEKSAYCTPLLLTLKNRKLLVTHTADHIIGIDASDGAVLWSYKHPNKYSIHPNRPIYYKGGLFCFSGYGQGCVKLALSSDGSTIKNEWSTKKLDSKMGGAVLVDGYLYGSGDSNREWCCLDWGTGEVKYINKSVAKGNVIYADGKLYCYSERGELALVEATPGNFNVLSKVKVTHGTAQHWAHPAINNGILYVRHGQSLIAYKVK